jgi:hypothetical protein
MLWKKIDIVENPPFYLETDDLCYYARDYISKGGYAASEANGLISNFKKDISKKGTNQWRYKVNAAYQFADELSKVLPKDSCISFLPTSKCCDDGDFDPRFEMTEARLKTIRPDIIVEWPIRRKQTASPAHFGTAKRKIQSVYDDLEWVGFSVEQKCVVLIDDVITCGTNFKACQRLIRENTQGVTILGLFWARTVWNDQSSIQAPTF